ncbi:hypothetical protein OG555_19225 [Kribbella sp. NBC_01484]|uniref:hypothetical protein n=1 Tax=Kribbella sp. NBC_01484 TaxID=2903579 RepID=UPI002E358BAC|nr:hypothetical protein [Kribbella sp. NBC_01484]
MPAVREAPTTVLETLQEKARGIVAVLEAYVTGPTGPVDPAAAAAAIGLMTKELLTTIPSLGAAAPADTDRFIVPDGQAPGPNQATLHGFFVEVANTLATNGVIEASVANPVGTALAALSTKIGIDPETWVRWMFGIREKATALDSAKQLAKAVQEFFTPNGGKVESDVAEDIPEEFPSYDDVKEVWLKQGTPPDWVAKIVRLVSTNIPGGTSVSDRTIGQAVHKDLMAVYARDFPDHCIVVDSRATIESRKKDDAKDGTLLISRLFTDTVIENWPDENKAKLAAYWAAMHDEETGARVRPDIADLHDAASGVNPKEGWGWFEIKPMHSLARAFEELFSYYLRLWNDSDAVTHNLPEWTGKPGTWQPPLCKLLRTLTPMRVYAAVTVPPGCIGYLSVEVKAGLEAAAAAAAVAAMAALIARRLVDALRDLYRNVDAMNPVTLLLGLVLVAAVLVVLFEVELVALPFEVIAALIGLVSSEGLRMRLQQLAQTL